MAVAYRRAETDPVARTRVIDLRDHGVSYGDASKGTVNKQAFADAFTAMTAQGVRRLHVGEGDIYSDLWSSGGTITLPTGVNATLEGGSGEGSRLIFPGLVSSGGYITAGGSIAAVPASGGALELTANAAVGATSITLRNASSLVAGQTYLLGDDSGFSTANPTRLRGEQVRVKSVNTGTNVVALWGELRDSYATASAAGLQLLTFDRPTFRNFAIVNSQPGTGSAGGINLRYAEAAVIEGFHAEGLDGAGVYVKSCRDSLIDARVLDLTDDLTIAFGYGIDLNDATENCEANIRARRVRHAVTLDGTDNARGVPRGNKITGVATECTSAAFDSHPHSADNFFHGVKADRSTIGLQLRGVANRATAVTITDCAAGAWLKGVGSHLSDFRIQHIQGQALGGVHEPLSNYDGHGIDCSEDHARIANGSIQYTAKAGIQLTGSYCQIRNLDVFDTGQDNVFPKVGIYLTASSSFAVTGNEVERCRFGNSTGASGERDIAGLMDNAVRWGSANGVSPTLNAFRHNRGHNLAVGFFHASPPAGTTYTDEHNYLAGSKEPWRPAYGVQTFTKAGAAVDADFTTPADGLLVVDTQTHRLGARIAGAYEYVAIDAGAPTVDERRYLKRTNSIAETMPRNVKMENLGSFLTSQRTHLVAIVLPAGRTITKIGFLSGTQALVAGSNQFFALLDSARNVLRFTADDTNVAWAANAEKELLLATDAALAANTTYTPTTTALHYLMILINASTVPSLAGAGHLAAASALAPVMTGSGDTGRTNTASIDTTAHTIGAGSIGFPYAWVA